MNRKAKSLTRRQFLKRAVAGTSAGIALPTIVPNAVFGAFAPSNRITIGCIGVGGMGMNNLMGFMGNPGAEIVAVCDVDRNHRENARVTAKLDAKRAYNDFREVLERPDIDAVVVTTPDHWHVPISIAAAKAGKDIYCEKPLSLTIAEGRSLCDVVKQYKTVLQTGTQQRSGIEFRRACELVRNGRIGKLHTIKVRIPKNNRTCPDTWNTMKVPEGFDYDMWLGPAPSAPYTEQRCHYQFRFIFDYSGGQVTNWGAHHLDIAQWGSGTDHTGPVEISGQGVFPRKGLFNTAEKVHIEYTYADGVKLMCDTGETGTQFVGTEGRIFVDRGKLNAEPKSILESKIKPNEIHLYHSNDHKQNFLDCIRSRKKPAADVEVGHRSATLCHLGNIAMLLGRKLNWEPQMERFTNDAEANRMLSRSMRAPWRL